MVVVTIDNSSYSGGGSDPYDGVSATMVLVTVGGDDTIDCHGHIREES